MKDKIMRLARKMVETALANQACQYDLDCSETTDYIATEVAAEEAEEALKAALDDMDLPYDHMGERFYKDPYHKRH
jgi:threonyl-tRNA synthetase